MDTANTVLLFGHEDAMGSFYDFYSVCKQQEK